MRRSPAAVTSALADWLNLQPEGAKFSVNQLAEATDVHWLTSRSYLRLFEYVHSNIPIIRNENAAVQILTPSPAWSTLRSEYPEAFVLVKLLRWVNSRKPRNVSALEWEFDLEQTPLSGAERGVSAELVESDLLKQGKRGLSFTKTGMRVATSAFADFIAPTEHVLTGEFLFDQRVVEFKERFAKLAESLEILKKSAESSRKERALFARSEQVHTAMETYTNASMLNEFLEQTLHESEWREGPGTKPGRSVVSYATLQALLGLNSLLQLEKPPFDVLIVERLEDRERFQRRLSDERSTLGGTGKSPQLE